MQAATLMYEPIPELLSFVDSQWCIYSRLFHAGGWACAIFFALTHLWGGLPFHQQVIFNHNFWMTTFTRLFIMKIFTLFDFNLPFGTFLDLPQSNLSSLNFYAFFPQWRLGIFSENFQMCASESWLTFVQILRAAHRFISANLLWTGLWLSWLSLRWLIQSLRHSLAISWWHVECSPPSNLIFLGQPVSTPFCRYPGVYLTFHCWPLIFVFRGISRHTAHWGGPIKVYRVWCLVWFAENGSKS